MHSADYPEHGITVHFNGDYSGDAKIVLPNSLSISTEYGSRPEVTIPCEVLTEFGNEAARSKIIAAIEDLEL